MSVRFVCEQGSSPVATCGGARRVGGYQSAVRGWSDARDGGIAGLDVEVRIDRTAPRVWAERHGGAGTPMRCRASDDRSGVESCRLTWTRSRQESDATHGRGVRRQWTAVAVDRAGNRTTRTGGVTR